MWLGYFFVLNLNGSYYYQLVIVVMYSWYFKRISICFLLALYSVTSYFVSHDAHLAAWFYMLALLSLALIATNYPNVVTSIYMLFIIHFVHLLYCYGIKNNFFYSTFLTYVFSLGLIYCFKYDRFCARLALAALILCLFLEWKYQTANLNLIKSAMVLISLNLALRFLLIIRAHWFKAEGVSIHTIPSDFWIRKLAQIYILYNFLVIVECCYQLIVGGNLIFIDSFQLMQVFFFQITFLSLVYVTYRQSFCKSLSA